MIVSKNIYLPTPARRHFSATSCPLSDLTWVDCDTVSILGVELGVVSWPSGSLDVSLDSSPTPARRHFSATSCPLSDLTWVDCDTVSILGVELGVVSWPSGSLDVSLDSSLPPKKTSQFSYHVSHSVNYSFPRKLYSKTSLTDITL